MKPNINSGYSALEAFCKVLIDTILEHKSQNKLEEIPYQKVPVKDVDFLMGNLHYDWKNVGSFTNYVWRPIDFSIFMNRIESMNECKSAIKELKDQLGLTDKLASKKALFSFIRMLMIEVPFEVDPYSKIDFYIAQLVSSYDSVLNKKPIVWEVVLWLSNIYLELEELKIANGIFLRRPSKDQLAVVRQDTYISESDKMFGKELSVGALLSFSLEVQRSHQIGAYPEEIAKEIEIWLSVLRLFKPSEVRVIYQQITPITIFEYSFAENIDKPMETFPKRKVDAIDTSRFNLGIFERDLKALRSFVKEFKPLLAKMSNQNYLSGDLFDIAYHRYIDALLGNEINVHRMVSSMTSLEALFSTNESEINFRIKLFTAKLLQFLGFNGVNVSDNIKKAYDVRSKLVHGNDMKKLLEFARKHIHEIINYNRICLLIAFQLHEELKTRASKNKRNEKEEFNSLIYNSFIDKGCEVELKKLMRDKVRISVLNPFTKHVPS